jgi:hypothetical protein
MAWDLPADEPRCVERLSPSEQRRLALTDALVALSILGSIWAFVQALS